MNSTPRKRGFLPSSTPIQQFYDSGYFGSSEPSTYKAIHHLSPVKECSSFKKHRITEFNYSPVKKSETDNSNYSPFKKPKLEDFDESPFKKSKSKFSNGHSVDSAFDSLSKKILTPTKLNSTPDKVSEYGNRTEFNYSPVKKSEIDNSNHSPFKKPKLEDFDESPFKKFKTKYSNGHSVDSTFDSLSKKILTPTKLNFTPDKVSEYGNRVTPSEFVRKLNFNDSTDSFADLNSTQGSVFSWCSSDSAFYSLSSIFTLSIGDKSSSLSRRPRVDILTGLYMRNCCNLLSSILRRLSELDLSRVHNVCRTWRKIVQCDPVANDKRKLFMKTARENKENKNVIQRSLSLMSGLPLALINAEATFKQPLAKEYNTKFSSFLKEGQSTPNRKLLKCPVCFYAAKEILPKKFTCVQCNFKFCGRCLSPLLASHNCSKPKETASSVPNLIIGSEKSKKNLKRLRRL